MVLTLLAAAFSPLPQNERYRSIINVVRDGGREEVFIIQWPQDRLAPVAAAGGLLTGEGSALLDSAGARVGAEVFRLRDVGGNIIGLASRSTGDRAVPGNSLAQGSDWTLLLPSRGALFLTQLNARDVALRPAADGRLVAAVDRLDFWAGEQSLRITAGPAPAGTGRVVGGAAEFANLEGSYDEEWALERVAADGRTSGRITLTTRVAADP